MNTDEPTVIQFKKKHPGIPTTWKGIGSGGNATVWCDGLGNAVKRLSPNASPEAITRFEKEAEIAKSLQARKGLHIVPIREIRSREQATEIVMEQMDGSLEMCVSDYLGNAKKAARDLLPIVETVHHLASLSPPLHHRDIKPANILYKNTGDGIRKLFLSDFGCAHFVGDDRITPKHRAVGALAYRAPEYSAGRVEKVCEKGDVYSLGKVFWSMIHGQKKFVFPYTLWHLEEYDLTQKFPDSKGIGQAMLIIASTVRARPENRPTLSVLRDHMHSLATDDEPTENSFMMHTDLLQTEELFEIEYEQRKTSTIFLIRTVRTEISNALAALQKSFPKSALVHAWLIELSKTKNKDNHYIQQVAFRESDTGFFFCNFRRIEFHSNFNPEKMNRPASFDIVLVDNNKNTQFRFSILAASNGLTAEWQSHDENLRRSAPYETRHLREFFEESLKNFIGN